MSGGHHHGGALLRMGIVVGCAGARRRDVRGKGTLIAGRGRRRRSSLVGRMRRCVGRESPRRAQLDGQRRPRRHARLQRRSRMYVIAGRAVIQAWMGSLLLARRYVPGWRSVHRRSVVVDDGAEVHGRDSRLCCPRGHSTGGPFGDLLRRRTLFPALKGRGMRRRYNSGAYLTISPAGSVLQSSGCFDFSLVLRHCCSRRLTRLAGGGAPFSTVRSTRTYVYTVRGEYIRAYREIRGLHKSYPAVPQKSPAVLRSP